MTTDQTIMFGILAVALALFVWGRWRYDLVAVLALLAVVLAGLVPSEEAFAGFAHPAVVTVAAVLVISRALQNGGAVDLAAGLLAPLKGRPQLQLAGQTAIIAVLSAVMNNVGAMALMLPVALQNAYREGYPPAKTLMPLAFGSLLGGLTTMIGTPPNIIIASFREQAVGEPFRMFDFTAVGGAVALAGIAFIITVGWRLVPLERKGMADPKQLFEIANYVAEARVPEGAKAIGRTVRQLEEMGEEPVTFGSTSTSRTGRDRRASSRSTAIAGSGDGPPEARTGASEPFSWMDRTAVTASAPMPKATAATVRATDLPRCDRMSDRSAMESLISSSEFSGSAWRFGSVMVVVPLGRAGRNPRRSLQAAAGDVLTASALQLPIPCARAVSRQ